MEVTKENIISLTDEQKSDLLIQLNKSGYDNYLLADIFNITVRDLIDYLKEINSYYKECNNPECSEGIQLYTEFSKRSAALDNLNPKCKTCVKEWDKQHYIETRVERLEHYRDNKEELSAQRFEWGLKNKDKISGYNSQYYNDNKEKITEYMLTRKDERRDAVRKHHQNNRAKMREYTRRYNLNKVQATPSWANLDKIQKIYQQAIDLEKQDGIKRHVHHEIPLHGVDENGVHVVCGLHIETNLQILTESENLKKGNKFNANR